MCFAGLGAIGGILSAVGGIIGAMVSAAGAQQQAESQAQAAEYNAALERNNAKAEAYKGTYESEIQREKGRTLEGRQRAAYGVSGALVDTGTPLTVFGETETDVNLDVAAAQWDARVKSQAHTNTAELYMMQARNARAAGQTAAASAIIGGFGGVGKLFGGGGFGSQVTTFGS